MSRIPTHRGVDQVGVGSGRAIKLSGTSTPGTPYASAVAAYIQIAKKWELSDPEAMDLIGVDEPIWNQMKRTQWQRPLTRDALERIVAVIGIYVTLHTVLDPRAADSWIRWGTVPASGSSQQPIAIMISGGLRKLFETRCDLEARAVGL